MSMVHLTFAQLRQLAASEFDWNAIASVAQVRRRLLT